MTSTSLTRAISGRLAKNPLRKAWLAARVAGLMCLLPILVRIYTLPALLQRLTPNHPTVRRNKQIEEIVGVIFRVCRFRFFQLIIIPRPCLRQSLALYHVLKRMGYPAEFHLGVRKDAGDLIAHSWVTFEGEPIAEGAGTGVFKLVYSYPPKSI